MEESHPMTEAPSETTCVICEKTVERYYGPTTGAFILKGGGWPSKDLRGGKTQKGEGISQNKKLEDVQNAREKMGLDAGKEKPMSEEEFQRRKKLNQRWLDETK